MDTKVIDERMVVGEFKSKNHQEFFNFIDRYEKYIEPIMRARGYRCVNRSERTVLFTFGEITFSRTRWYKGKKCRIPVDEKLGLEKNHRYSRELLYQIAKLATMTSYRQVVTIIEMTYQIDITKDTVLTAVKLAGTLLEEKKDYKYFQENIEPKKIKTKTLYIEGDGLHLKVQNKDERSIELSRFVIHTGSKPEGKNRFGLENKKVITSINNREARDLVFDYIYNHFELEDDTILITNSDLGKGYSIYIFEELAKALKVKRHEHFWDRYHINKDIKRLGQKYGQEISELLFKAIDKHDKSLLRTAFDTIMSLVVDDEEAEWVSSYHRKFSRNFQYTKTPQMRGIANQGLGIMESQHRKISYRMKHRGMYWSRFGANSMSQMIDLFAEGKLRDLFFGDWRVEYEKMKKATKTASPYLKEVKVREPIFKSIHRMRGDRSKKR
ncbi:ISLre2 family transposase [Streptococcus canis]|uniref:ISLre2 family transposase n=1 Tax=Streptococcus canis FSL Z3-227 TaxID=482234 RepID=A0AAV3FU49_STRCB|nr:ISLre2 family transposase [Streptococcus canis]EIQ82666.1 hypothetical protein SCAZ3_09905 [Streptococcus canis FSL Z3-227]